MKKKLTALFTTGIMLLSAAPAPMEAAADKTAPNPHYILIL